MTSAKTQTYKTTRVWRWARDSWIGAMVRTSRSVAHESLGWLRCGQFPIPDTTALTRSIESLRAALPDSNNRGDQDAPIFLLSTGWRAGSTLLQRILLTDPHLLLWGEPLGEMGLISRIAEMVNDSLSQRDLKLWHEQDSRALSSLTTSWIATLTPPGSDLRAALRSMLDQWLGVPARRLGFTRWGLKEVRLGAAEAVLLSWLFPKARFVSISRHPYDCYRSFTDSGWRHLYYRHPEVRIDSAVAFAQHWNRIARGWCDLPAGFPIFHIRYEDLARGKVDFRELEVFLGIEIKENIALSSSIGGTAVRGRLNWLERTIIAREASEGMRKLGYSKSVEDNNTQTRMLHTEASPSS